MTRRSVLAALLTGLAALGARAQEFQADLSFPYALHGWNTVGCSADLGWSLAGSDFVGLEWTAFHPHPLSAFPGVGPVRVDQHFQILQVVGRHRFLLGRLGPAGGGFPLGFYLGGGAGLGRVRQTLPAATFSAGGPLLGASTTEVSGELVAGFQLDLGPRGGVRAGCRYLDSFNNVNQFGAGVNTDTKALEVGLYARF